MGLICIFALKIKTQIKKMFSFNNNSKAITCNINNIAYEKVAVFSKTTK